MGVVDKNILADLLSEYSGITRDESLRFLDSFVDVVVKHVLEGQSVEVQGLGTFEIIDTQQADMRRVALKVSDNMKDEVNAPFAFFETYKISELKPVEPVIVIEENNISNESDENFGNAQTENTVSVTESEVVDTLEKEVKTSNVSIDSVIDSHHSNNKVLYTSIALIFISVAMLLAYLLNGNNIQEIDVIEEIDRPNVQVIEKPAKQDVELTEIIEEQQSNNPLDHRLKDNDGNLIQVTLKEGERLTLISLRQFGSKDFWPYIYDVNSDVLSSPSHVYPGVNLYLPDPEYFNINKDEASSLDLARKRGQELINK